MSISKWAYTPWKCDGQPCPGDCDHCPKAYEDETDNLTDYISRADAINAVAEEWLSEASAESPYVNDDDIGEYRKLAEELFEDVPSADAEPKWNCTANFIAEQLDRLRKMTDEEKWNFFREFFGMGDAVQGEWHQISPARIYECSICNHNVLTDYIDTYNYCPSCGARMKGGDDE